MTALYTVGDPHPSTAPHVGDIWTIPVLNEHGQRVFRFTCKDPVDVAERTLDAIEECARMNGEPPPPRPKPAVPGGRHQHGETSEPGS